MARYAQWLLEALRGVGHEVTLTRAEVHAGRIAHRVGSLAKWLGYVDKFLIFPLRLRRQSREADVVHVLDHGNAMYVRHLKRRPHLVTCHDLLAVRCALGQVEGIRVGVTGKIFQRLIRQGLEQAQQVICVSLSTLNDLYAVTTMLQSSPVLIENPLNWPYSPMPADDAWRRIRSQLPQLKVPFLLHVGGNQWYKNRPGVVEIFAALRASGGEFSELSLVMAGKPFYPGIEAVLTPELRTRVLPLISPDNETLQALYSVSQALLFPSLAEGFGWPIVEAQACGALVITSDRPPMNQIAGTGAILVDPTNPPLAAKQIAGAWSQRESLRRAGRANVARYDSRLALQKYLHVYVSAATGKT